MEANGKKNAPLASSDVTLFILKEFSSRCAKGKSFTLLDVGGAVKKSKEEGLCCVSNEEICENLENLKAHGLITSNGMEMKLNHDLASIYSLPTRSVSKKQERQPKDVNQPLPQKTDWADVGMEDEEGDRGEKINPDLDTIRESRLLPELKRDDVKRQYDDFKKRVKSVKGGGRKSKRLAEIEESMDIMAKTSMENPTNPSDTMHLIIDGNGPEEVDQVTVLVLGLHDEKVITNRFVVNKILDENGSVHFYTRQLWWSRRNNQTLSAHPTFHLEIKKVNGIYMGYASIHKRNDVICRFALASRVSSTNRIILGTKTKWYVQTSMRKVLELISAHENLSNKN